MKLRCTYTILPIFTFIFLVQASAQEELRASVRIEEDRISATLRILNNNSEDYICSSVQFNIEICDDDFCKNNGEIHIKTPAIYSEANSTRDFFFNNLTDDFKYQSTISLINKVQKTLLVDCHPAQLLDYCTKAAKTEDELHTLKAILNKLSSSSCDIDSGRIKELNLAKTELRNLKPLVFFPSLETLYLQHNFIEDVSPLGTLPHLRKIQLDENSKLQSIDPLFKLKELESIYARETLVKALPPELPSQTMQHIYIQGPARVCEIKVRKGDGTLAHYTCDHK